MQVLIYGKSGVAKTQENEQQKKNRAEPGFFDEAELSRQLLLQQLGDLRRIRLALRRLHALADQRVDGRFLAGLVLLDRLRVVGEDLVDDRFQRARVRDLLQAFALDDRVGQVFVARLRFPHQAEDLLAGVVRDRAVGDALQQQGQLRRFDRRVLDGDVGAVQRGRHVAHQPVRGRLGVFLAGLGDDGFVIRRHRLRRRQDQRVVLGQAVVADEALAHRGRQFRHAGFHAVDPLLRDRERRQVGVGEVAVVLRVFLAAHLARFLAVRVPQARGLHDLAAVLDQLDLAAHLVMDRFFHEAERVQVLDLAARAEFLLADGAHGHVDVAAERTFLHVAVADAQPHHEAVQRFRVGDGFRGAADFRLGDDLQQRRAGAVQVDAAHAVVVLVQRLAGVFLEVGAGQVDGLRLQLAVLLEREREAAALHDRVFELADLVTLRQVGIKVVLAREDGLRRNPGADREAEADGAFDGALVHHGQHARQRQVDGARLRVRLGAELDRAAAEDFGVGRELDVVLKTDDDFPLHSILSCMSVPAMVGSGSPPYELNAP